MVVDFGTLTLLSDIKSTRERETTNAQTTNSNSTSTNDNTTTTLVSRNNLDDYYDEFRLNMVDLEAIIATNQDQLLQWRKQQGLLQQQQLQMKQGEARIVDSLHLGLVEPFSIQLHLKLCRIDNIDIDIEDSSTAHKRDDVDNNNNSRTNTQNDSSNRIQFTRMIVEGALPKLRFNISQEKGKQLMKVITQFIVNQPPPSLSEDSTNNILPKVASSFHLIVPLA